MDEIGEILHVAGSGRVIIRISGPLQEGQILCDKKGTRVAKVMELIGPTKEPFASASSLTNSIKKYVGKTVFATTSHQDSRRHKPHQHNAQKTRRRETR